MSATVIPFRRDLKKVLAPLITFNGPTSVEDMLHRHQKIIEGEIEAWKQKKSGLATIDDIEEFHVATNNFHIIALEAGVDKQIVDAFNKERTDWKNWKAYRDSRPPHRRV